MLTSRTSASSASLYRLYASSMPNTNFSDGNCRKDCRHSLPTPIPKSYNTWARSAWRWSWSSSLDTPVASISPYNKLDPQQYQDATAEDEEEMDEEEME